MLKKIVEDIICFDIQMVAERIAPERTAPKEAILVENFREICLECPNHDE
ncbi:hypothetical protein [Chakrabartyella piscis]|nr:hypothetical protein [Chakrabartyella piscis]